MQLLHFAVAWYAFLFHYYENILTMTSPLLTCWAPLASLLLLASCPATSAIEQVPCDPCTERQDIRIRGITHGAQNSPFWQRVKAAADQAGLDMNVNMQYDLYEGDEFTNFQIMAEDIRSVATSANPPHALVVTIPTDDVVAAVSEAVQAGVPVFGLNSGDRVAKDAGVLGFVAMDEYLAGAEAGNGILAAASAKGLTIGRALYTNHAPGNSAIEERASGFNDTLAGVPLHELVIDLAEDSKAIGNQVASTLEGCPYDAMLMLGSTEVLLDPILEANCPNMLLGAIDANGAVYAAIVMGQVAVGISQQEYLQGVLPIVMAATYVTTGGQLLVPPADSDTGIYRSGPKVITSENVPSDTEQVCELESYPTCPNELSSDGVNPSECACVDRSTIRIGGVVHGVTTDDFWDTVFSAAEQAARDMGVELDFDRFEPEASQAILYERMSNRIRTLCVSGIDGLFVSIPSEVVLESIQYCQSLNIPVVSINSGGVFAETLGQQHHIGQIEYNAGVLAGQELVKGFVGRAFCVSYEPGNVAFSDRCIGLEQATKRNILASYGGEIDVPPDSAAQFQQIVEGTVESFLQESGQTTWEAVALLLTGQAVVGPAMDIKEDHPEVTIGTFDVSDTVYEGLDNGDLAFGTSQQSYLQGYFPVILLTHMIQADEQLQTSFIETGPEIVRESPSDEERVCSSLDFAVCQPPPPAPASSVNNTAVIIAVSIVGGVLVLALVFLMYRLNKLSKHIEVLEKRGQAVPKMSMRRRLSSVRMPLDRVVEEARRESVIAQSAESAAAKVAKEDAGDET